MPHPIGPFANNAIITGDPSGGQTFIVASYGDEFLGGGDDVFTVVTQGSSCFNTYLDSNSVIEGGAANTFIGLAGDFGPSNGISTISSGGYAGVLLGDGSENATLDLSATILSDVTIFARAEGQTIIGSLGGHDAITVDAYNDHFEGTGGDVFTVVTQGSSCFNTYLDSNSVIEGGAANAFIGLAGDFGPSNGISTIGSGGYAGVMLGDGSEKATLDLSGVSVSDVQIWLGGNGMTFWAPGGDQSIITAGYSVLLNFAGSVGNDTIASFRAGDRPDHDVISLTADLAPDGFAALMNNAADSGGNTVISLHNGGSLTLEGVSKAQLTAADFNLPPPPPPPPPPSPPPPPVVDIPDPGPSLTDGYLSVSPGQKVDITAYLNGLITPGLPGDTESITSVSGAALLTANGAVVYQAPSSGLADSFTYTVTDQHGDTATAQVSVAITHARNVVSLAGQNNTVSGPTTPGPMSGQTGTELLGSAAGFAQLTGGADDRVIIAQGYGNLIMAGGGNDQITAGTGGANVEVSDTNGNNVITGSTGATTLTLGDGNNTISLGGDNNLITLGTGDNVVMAGAGDDSVSVAGGRDTITVGGHNDRISVAAGHVALSGMAGDALITLGGSFGSAQSDVLDLVGVSGDSVAYAAGALTVFNPDRSIYAVVQSVSGASLTATVSGSDLLIAPGSRQAPPPAPLPVPDPQGGANITLASGNNALVLGGYNDVVNIFGDNNSITGSLGAARITISGVNSSINAAGYNNVITLGGGNNKVSGVAGASIVSVGDGASTILLGGALNRISTGSGASIIQAGSGEDIVNTNAGNDIVTLSGSGNLVIGGLGYDQISGGVQNTYRLNGVTSAGQLDVLDFSAAAGDVLDLRDFTNTLSQGRWSVSGQTDTADPTALDVFLSIDGTQYQVATLHGAGASFAGLVGSGHVLV